MTLAETININGLDPKLGLYLAPHILGPGFGAEYPYPELYLFAVDLHLVHRFCQVECIGRSARKDGSFKILHDLKLARGISTGNGNDDGAYFLSPP
jgi:hypothetical protein